AETVTVTSGAAVSTEQMSNFPTQRSTQSLMTIAPGTGRSGLKDASKVLTPEEQRRQEIVAKLHPSVVAVINRLLSKGTQPTADEQKFVRDGKAELQVWLVDKTPEALEELKQLGFEIVLDPKTSKLVIGRIAIAKLSALAELKSVRYIAPQLKGV
ncbi:MAG: hypothetical protein LC731_01405, partial [Acidobacteria bacterium]|nr:hypothetical protein [Acidobacteriota bacterium]